MFRTNIAFFNSLNYYFKNSDSSFYVDEGFFVAIVASYSWLANLGLGQVFSL